MNVYWMHEWHISGDYDQVAGTMVIVHVETHFGKCVIVVGSRWSWGTKTKTVTFKFENWNLICRRWRSDSTTQSEFFQERIQMWWMILIGWWKWEILVRSDRLWKMRSFVVVAWCRRDHGEVCRSITNAFQNKKLWLKAMFVLHCKAEIFSKRESLAVS